MMWNNSKCVCGRLHDYRISKIYPEGVIETCRKCNDRKWFSGRIQNHIYLSYHLRSALQPNNPRYRIEYK